MDRPFTGIARPLQPPLWCRRYSTGLQTQAKYFAAGNPSPLAGRGSINAAARGFGWDATKRISTPMAFARSTVLSGLDRDG